jgi:hypothetical protein
MIQVRFPILICISATLGTAGIVFALILHSKTMAADISQQDPLKQLLQERKQVRRQIVDVYEKLAHGKAVGLIEIKGATIKLLQAELDLAESKADRIAIHDKIVVQRRDIEDMMSRTQPRSVDAMVARADRIEAQIALQREKQN